MTTLHILDFSYKDSKDNVSIAKKKGNCPSDCKKYDIKKTEKNN